MEYKRKNNKINKVFAGLNTGIKNFIIPSVDILVSEMPDFLLAWMLVKGFYGSLFDIHQEKINEFVDYLRENKDVFIKEIIETKDFKDGFVLTFEEYLKQRNMNKRKIIQKIFLGFSTSDNRESFELERMYDILNKISLSHANNLKIIEYRNN